MRVPWKGRHPHSTFICATHIRPLYTQYNTKMNTKHNQTLITFKKMYTKPTEKNTNTHLISASSASTVQSVLSELPLTLHRM